jgi:DNA mismatch repair protein MutS
MIQDPELALTPMLEQYFTWKRAYPDCLLFFRMGDFYEMFFEDAREASRLLDIALTARDSEKKIPMAGVPHHAVEPYLDKLVKAGRKVAICEQLTEPDGRTLVERRVVRLVTPGTYVPEDARGEGRLAAVSEREGRYSLALLHPGSGQLEAGTLDSIGAMGLLAAFSPMEVLVPQPCPEKLRHLLGQFLPETCLVSEKDRSLFEPKAGEAWLCRRWEIPSLRTFGLDDGDPAAGPGCAILRYFEETQFGLSRHVLRLHPLAGGSNLRIDAQSQKNLELLDSDSASLYGVLNRCRTPMGKRLLREWVLRPLLDLVMIRGRQDAVGFLKDSPTDRTNLLEGLQRCRDIERSIGRLSLNLGSPHDLAAIRDTLTEMPTLVDLGRGGPLEPFLSEAPDLSSCLDGLKERLSDNPPRNLKDGGVIRKGADPELDEWRSMAGEAEEWLNAYMCRERARTGIPNLKVGNNRVFGYFIEIPRSQLEKAPTDYTRRQTLVSAERFVTPELKSYEEKILKASEEAQHRESLLYEALRERVLSHAADIQKTGQVLARLDCLASLADVAWERRYERPVVNDGERIRISGGRHPVVETTLGNAPYTPNSVELDRNGKRMAILTGPNMAGKSTYLRMSALLVIMAQMGGFVPAEAAEIGLVDRIFTRIGAHDELALGRSTFLVEMLETAQILNNLTERSFVVLDEVGRGTSTYDGMSIAWAVLEHLHARVDCRPLVLFATHFHELTELGGRFPEIMNLSMAVEETSTGVRFLHRVKPGPADRSYGIEVARLAGIPEPVILRAQFLLEGFEKRPKGDTPAVPTEMEAEKGRVQLNLFPSGQEALLDEIAALEPDRLSPLAALETLYRLAERSREVRSR